MEIIIDKMSQTNWVMKITLFAILMLAFQAKFLSPAMGKYTQMLSF
jgi:hypothetical protein